jgi:type IV pilus assembly protein PilC
MNLLRGDLMATAPLSSESFAYRAESAGGQTLSGTIDAATTEAADTLLRSLGLKVLEVSPARRPVKLRALRGDEFIAFNQQLARLTQAGLPVEQGLRLIAKDVRSGRLASTINALAGELESGVPLPEAFEKHRHQFPPLYGRLIDAGVRANNLPAMLLNLGRHAQLIQRMRAMMWEALSYPAMVLAATTLLISFLGLFVLPRFELIFKDFGTRLPMITQVVLNIANNMPIILATIGAAVLLVVLATMIIRFSGLAPAAHDAILLHVPLLGPVLERNLVARWCDAMATAVSSGLDLPAAIALSGDAVRSPKLKRDGDALIRRMEAAQSLDGAELRILPATIPAVLELSAAGKDLPGALETLGLMYQQQAELRLVAIPAILTPLLFILIGLVIGLVTLAMFAPIISLIQAVSH